MDGGAWWATVHGVAKSRTRLSDFTSKNPLRPPLTIFHPQAPNSAGYKSPALFAVVRIETHPSPPVAVELTVTTKILKKIFLASLASIQFFFFSTIFFFTICRPFSNLVWFLTMRLMVIKDKISGYSNHW